MRRLFQRFTSQRAALIVFLAVTAVAVASTKMVDVIMTNSTINSSPIGASVASSGAFTTLSAQVPPANPTPINHAWMGWNAMGNGEADFIVNTGTGGPNAFAWFAATSAAPNYNTGNPLALLDRLGNFGTSLSVSSATIIGTTEVTSPYGAFGYTGSGSSSTSAALPQGAYTMWNLSGGSGETNFVNSRGAGAGGFRWYIAATGSLPGTLEMTMNSDGSLVNSHGFHGNADTASALAANPPDCATNIGAAGIGADGTAACNSWPQSFASSGWSTLPGGLIIEWGQTGTFDTGPVGVTLPHTFPSGCLQATVSDVFSSASRIESLVSCSTTTITIRNNGSGIASFIAIGH
jgi:hypothetical protein